VSGTEYEETVAATRVGTLIERFTPECEVVSVIFALSEDGESELLALQRDVYAGDEDEGVCLVLSPSQRCSYEPFEELTLTRSSLGMKFTDEAREVFNAASVLVTFDVADDVFEEVRGKLEVLCAGKAYFGYAKDAV
jgi:hypothetical protein